MNYNVSRIETGNSQLDKIEMAYLKSLAGKNITPEQLEQIERILVTNPQMMDQPELYSGLERVEMEFQLLKSQSIAIASSLSDSFTK